MIFISVPVPSSGTPVGQYTLETNNVKMAYLLIITDDIDDWFQDIKRGSHASNGKMELIWSMIYLFVIFHMFTNGVTGMNISHNS